jgi:hypothetical protein
MATFNSFFSSLIDGFLRPFRGVNPFWPLLIISVLTGVVLLFIFRFTSNQRGIQETKNRIKAHLLEVRIFKDDLRILLSAQKMILKYNFQYLGYGLKPLLVIFLPVALLLIQLEGWFGQRPLKPGESTLLSVRLADDAVGLLPEVALEGDEGLSIESPSLRIPSTREVDWKIRSDKTGELHLFIKLQGRTIPKLVTVSTGEPARVSPVKVSSDSWAVALHPGENPIAKDEVVRQITLDYPARSIEVFGWKLHWLLVFFVLSTLAGFLFKGLFKVEI